MPIVVGRSGFVGIAIESSPGTPRNPTDYIPFETCTLQGKHEPLADVQARGQRQRDMTSVVGKQHGEGEISLLLDVNFLGYFLKMALGTEAVASAGSGGYDHTFTLNQSSVPTTASVIVDKSNYRELFVNSVVDTLEISVSDGLANLKASMMAKFPLVTTSGTNTTASGINTQFSFKDLQVQFGANLAAAQAATATKVKSLTVQLKNNVEPVYRSGNQVVDTFSNKGFEVSGSYGLLLEDKTEVNNYYNLTKQVAIFTFTGALIGGSVYEKITITSYQFRVNDQPIETGIDNLYALVSNFVGEFSVTNAKTLDIVLRNSRVGSY